MVKYERNRDVITIMYDILDQLIDGDKLRTVVMYGARLSYSQISAYTENLLQKNMVELVPIPKQERKHHFSAVRLSITERGRVFHKRYTDMMAVFNAPIPPKPEVRIVGEIKWRPNRFEF